MSSSSWQLCMPENEIENFTERSDERRQLFEDAASRLPTKELSPLAWAFFQVGDLERLRSLSRDLDTWQLGETLLEYEAKDCVLLWKQHSAEKDASTSSKRSHGAAFNQPSRSLRSRVTSQSDSSRTRSGRSLGCREYSPVRDRRVAEKCKERDHGLCVVTKVSGIDACHVYPWCAFGGRYPDRVKRFWNVLRNFWPRDKVKSWQDKIFRDDNTMPPKGTETVESMLTLTSTLHRFHSEGAFALRPVRKSDDNTQLELEFHWLARQQRDSNVKLDLMEQPLSSRGLTDSGIGYLACRFMNATNPTLLVSGARFTMTTDDPVTKPLPDPGLMEMQWHLQRILAMSGAARWREEDFDYEEDFDDKENFDCEDLEAAAISALSVEQSLDKQPAAFE